MNAAFDPYREALVVETETLWPQEVAAPQADEKRRLEQRLHAAPDQVAQLAYVRLPTGFCRQITVTAEDLQRLQSGS